MIVRFDLKNAILVEEKEVYTRASHILVKCPRPRAAQKPCDPSAE
mgnify:CR=1 FL=1